ncbi:MAG: choice-of-anchor tandem repeat GloVer-containing protein [Terriglobales bacterium]
MQRTKSSFALNMAKGAAMMMVLLSALGVFADNASQASPEAKLKQTVTFTGAPVSAPDLSTFTVTATSNSGETATITATGSCTVSGDTVTMTKGTGTCSLKASWLANAQYLAATATQKTIAAVDWVESELWEFGSAPDATSPVYNGLVLDTAGNLYGTAGGGKYNDGAVFELTPNGQGGWNETVIHSFDPNSTTVHDGAGPEGSLAIDSKGNLYGTTFSGGANNNGVVYELSPGTEGTWTETILYSFGAAASGDGFQPYAGVTLGNTTGTVFYGTTSCGGTSTANSYSGCSNGNGTVYKLSYTKPTKTVTGGWKESVIYSFASNNANDGFLPQSGLLLNGGNLYGVTPLGGTGAYGVASYGVGQGTVYELKPGGSGWTEDVLYNFGATANDAAGPAFMIPVMDSKKNIYGTTSYGGPYDGSGTAWELVYSGSGSTYSEQVIYSFGAQSNDGCGPQWQIVPGKTAGTWFSTTSGCGEYGAGTFFELTYSPTTGWQETNVHQFTWGNDGGNWYPSEELIADKNGNLYGMTSAGGPNTNGVVFEFSPIQ